MPHQILKRFGIHSRLCHITAIGMSAYGEWFLVATPYRYGYASPMPTQNAFPNAELLPAYLSYPRTEPTVSVYHRLNFRLLAVYNNTLETLIDLICHRDYPCSAWCLGVLNDILHIPCSLELMIDINLPFLKINIRKCQSAKFRDTKPRLEQHKHSVIIPFVMLITFNKFQKLSLLFSRDCFPRNTIVNNYCT